MLFLNMSEMICEIAINTILKLNWKKGEKYFVILNQIHFWMTLQKISIFLTNPTLKNFFCGNFLAISHFLLLPHFFLLKYKTKNENKTSWCRLHLHLNCVPTAKVQVYCWTKCQCIITSVLYYGDPGGSRSGTCFRVSRLLVCSRHPAAPACTGGNREWEGVFKVHSAGHPLKCGELKV